MTAKAASRPAARKKAPSASPITLAIDIGGTGLKAMLIGPTGKALSERERILTPAPATPKAVLAALGQLVAKLPGAPRPAFDRVSVGFPGVTKHGITYNAVNLHPDWAEFNLQKAVEHRWKKPARVANDASVQGYGAVKGYGVEMIITLGTGMGSAIFTDGHLCPGLELGHHPWRKKTYEEYLGIKALKKLGKKLWNKLLQEAIAQTAATFNWDHLYLGGGNTHKIDFDLPKNVSIVSNEDGLLGGVALWRDQA